MPLRERQNPFARRAAHRPATRCGESSPVLSGVRVREELLGGCNSARHDALGGFSWALAWCGHVWMDELATVSPVDPAKVHTDIRSRSIPEPFTVQDWTAA